ncbi:LysR family transcriptional regulator [Roseateles asaccharophilus]|uniref:DNA-binding transcriptional LysR family regulator n=1 Tax=Roseateles asaccharophilus TaxID=582607 RepID=A0ABU2A6Y2_9BURK|nr:LysR family transcriptional regulator [Roseateles asaccharophilus]MDR7332934.1 DNA-binding transcriptional LysR family regulator [Roseateles asaccharophilus]
MDRLQAMEVFVAVVDHGGFASAARKLDLSAPVVTRAIAELEARLGVTLLTRTTRQVRVTEAGARYADDCRRILADVGETESATSGSRSRVQGTLSVTAPVLFGNLHVTPIVTDYLRRYPDVDAHCVFVDRVVSLIDEGLDVAVRIGELPDSTLRAVAVGRVRRMLVASPAYLAAHGSPQRPDDLAQHTLIQPTQVAPYPEWRFAEGGRPLVARIRPRLRTTTNDSARSAAQAGLGLTRLLSYQAADALGRGELVPLLQDFEPPPLPVNVVHHEGRHMTQKVRAFVDLAVEALRANPTLR